MNLDKKILEDIKRHKYYRSEKEGYIGIFQAAKEFFEEYPYIIEDELKGKEIDTSLVGFIIEDKNTNEKKTSIISNTCCNVDVSKERAHPLLTGK